MNNICVIILNYNGSEDTIECIKSIENINNKNNNIKVVIVDNNSSTDEFEKLNEFIVKSNLLENQNSLGQHEYILIKSNYNLGFAGGNNKAIRYVEEMYSIDYYVFLNNDTILNEDSVENLTEVFSDKRVGAASGLILENEYKKFIWYAGGHISKIKAKGIHSNYGENSTNLTLTKKETRFLSGCYVMFTREALMNIQLLNERYFFGTEEYDYSLKLRKLGYKLIFEPKSVIYHKVSIKKGNGSSHNINDLIYIYNSMRNKYILISTNSSFLYGKLWNFLQFIHMKFILKKKLVSSGKASIEEERINELIKQFNLYKGNLFIDNKEFTNVKNKLSSK